MGYLLGNGVGELCCPLPSEHLAPACLDWQELWFAQGLSEKLPLIPSNRDPAWAVVVQKQRLQGRCIQHLNAFSPGHSSQRYDFLKLVDGPQPMQPHQHHNSSAMALSLMGDELPMRETLNSVGISWPCSCSILKKSCRL